jgi:hypothetical protein
MLDECDSSDLEDVLSESNDEFIPQGDESELEDSLELNSEESDIAGAICDVDSDENYEFIAKSGRVWRSFVLRLLAVASVTLSQDLPGQRVQVMLQPQCTKFSTCFLMTKL